jgi:hypothetical protein
MPLSTRSPHPTTQPVNYKNSRLVAVSIVLLSAGMSIYLDDLASHAEVVCSDDNGFRDEIAECQPAVLTSECVVLRYCGTAMGRLQGRGRQSILAVWGRSHMQHTSTRRWAIANTVVIHFCLTAPNSVSTSENNYVAIVVGLYLKQLRNDSEFIYKKLTGSCGGTTLQAGRSRVREPMR